MLCELMDTAFSVGALEQETGGTYWQHAILSTIKLNVGLDHFDGYVCTGNWGFMGIDRRSVADRNLPADKFNYWSVSISTTVTQKPTHTFRCKTRLQEIRQKSFTNIKYVELQVRLLFCSHV